MQIFVQNSLSSHEMASMHTLNEVKVYQGTGDKKTPAEAKEFCEASAKEFGSECVYQTPEDQVEWLKKYPELGEEIPWNCIQRRNLAILLAYERGCDVIITIDDDNYFVEG